jgi:hypothetical protein
MGRNTHRISILHWHAYGLFSLLGNMAIQQLHGMFFPRAFPVLRCETYFTIIIRAILTEHLSWLV